MIIMYSINMTMLINKLYLYLAQYNLLIYNNYHLYNGKVKEYYFIKVLYFDVLFIILKNLYWNSGYPLIMNHFMCLNLDLHQLVYCLMSLYIF